MPSIFSRIIDGEIPGRFVWRDDRVVAFLSIEPMRPGHVLVVPPTRSTTGSTSSPSWRAHLFAVAQQIGRAQQAEWNPRRVGVLIVGDEVPHVHIHVVPINAASELSFANVDRSPAAEALDDAAERIRARLREMGRAEADQ